MKGYRACYFQFQNDGTYLVLFCDKAGYENLVSQAIDLENKAKDLKELFIDTAQKLGEMPHALKEKTNEEIWKGWKNYFEEIKKTLVLVEAYSKVNKSVGQKNLIQNMTLGNAIKTDSNKVGGLSSLVSNMDG